MVETNPLKWFVKEIDISDSAGKNNLTPSNTSKKSSSNQRTTEMFGHRPIRTRSRHDCHFSTGSSVPMGNLDPLNSLYHFIILKVSSSRRYHHSFLLFLFCFHILEFFKACFDLELPKYLLLFQRQLLSKIR